MVSPSILVVACAAAALAWLVLAIRTLVDRAAYDRRRGASLAAAEPELEQTLRRAGAHRGELGKWRRVTALRAIGRLQPSRARLALEAALGDADPDVTAASVRALGEAATTQQWAVDALVEALERESAPRSRIAAQLERLAPGPGARLLPLLDSANPEVRFWAVTLLASNGGLAASAIRLRTRDLDPSVRAAAAETLGAIGDGAALEVVLPLLDDPEWFVRAHACRAAAALGGLDVAPQLARLLADDRWWVRSAAKDGLRMLGPDTLGSLTPLLTSSDRFARNGAAELLQDLGIVDWLARDQPDSDLLQRIFTAGGERLRAAAMQRLGVRSARTADTIAA